MAKTSILNPIPYLLVVPLPKMWVDYDEDVDAMHINFRQYVNADESAWVDENVVYYYQDYEFVEMTIFAAAAAFGKLS